MKQLLSFLLITLFSPAILVANIAPPQAYITEIQVNSSGNWIIELGFSYYGMGEIDSLMLETSAGSALIGPLTFLPGSQGLFGFDSLALITIEDLTNPLFVQPDGDFVTLYSYSHNGNTVIVAYDYIAFGLWPGSYLPETSAGQSYAKVHFVQSAGWTSSFCLDDTPTIGLPNDTTGCLATLHGMVFDVDATPFTEGWFPFIVHNVSIHVQPDGSYCERLYARNYYEDTIFMRFPPWPNTVVAYQIEPVDVSIQPDTAVLNDFITLTMVASPPLPEKEKPDPVVFPNPFSDRITFYLPSQGSSSDQHRLRIYSEAGKLVFDQVVHPGSTQITWKPDSTAPPGAYIYHFGSESGGFSSGTVIRLNR